jgi:G:T/U-mismatch repair DNA glycosylase
MKQPLQINFRDIPPSEAVEARVREKAAGLDKFYDQIMSCRVMIKATYTIYELI